MKIEERPFLVATDLDDTLVGPTTLDREALRALNRTIERTGAALVYVTGRSLALTLDLIAEAELLLPHAFITSVGTQIHFPDDLDHPDPEWHAHLSLGWDLNIIEKTVAAYPQLRRQPHSEQGPFKRSFTLGPDDAWLIEKIEYTLAETGLRVRLVYSSDRDLDILPAAGVKGHAVRFLQERWGFLPERTVVCGDSGNDVSLFETGNRGIAVANAKPELVRWLTRQPNLAVYRASERCAAGILEGLRHWGWGD